jgi:hypothetical protein
MLHHSHRTAAKEKVSRINVKRTQYKPALGRRYKKI